MRWDPPGPGQWDLDRSHMHGGTTPLTQHLMSEAMSAGMRRVAGEIGAPFDTIDMRFVNGFAYTRIRPLIRPDKPSERLPPRALLWMAMRLHPEMRRRTRTAQRAIDERRWMTVASDWEQRLRPETEAKNTALQVVDLAALSDVEVMAHARAVVDHSLASLELHFYLHGYDIGPIGILLADAQRWGLDPVEVIPVLEGASPSTSEPSRLAERIRSRLDELGLSPTTLAETRAAAPDIAADIDALLARRGCTMVSRYDLDGLTLAEMPSVLLASILGGKRAADRTDEREALIAELRARVPEGDRDAFDERVADARGAMNMRDDNGPVTAEWPLGLLRMAMLEVGRRLVAHGHAEVPEHAFELGPDELTDSVLADGPAPEPGSLRARAADRRTASQTDPPARLGIVEPSPPLEVLPPGLARMVAAVQLSVTLMGMSADSSGSGLQGAGVGTVPYRGRARRADTPEEALDSMEPGDVLVVPCTTPAFNTVLALAGAVVTSEGGPLSHAAVLARELGIAAVVGAPGALTEIPDGAFVEVDPVHGVVRVLPADDTADDTPGDMNGGIGAAGDAGNDPPRD